MKIKLIIPYFGEFPSNFEFFLKSCEANQEIEFLIFASQSVVPAHPSNVSFHVLSFEELKIMAQKKLSLSSQSLRVLTPYKLCDYKPAYGLLFADYLQDADFWGFCDIDLIFGKIFDILSLEQLEKSERILTQGHLTFYKNTERINRMFDREIKGGICFRKAIEIKEPCFFDEIFMPAICKNKGVVQYGENVFADILPQYDSFVIAPLCAVQNKEGQTFCWENGKLYRVYAKGQDELMYIHLQKRSLPYSPLSFDKKVYITPQGFFTEDCYAPECEKPSNHQARNYQKKRWASFTPRKIWIKFKARRFKEQLS